MVLRRLRRSRGRFRAPLCALAGLCGISLGIGSASAFAIESPVGEGCHEAITAAAIAEMSAPPDGAISLLAASPLDAEQRSVFSALGIDLPEGAGYVAASMIAGVRWNDLMGADPLDLVTLAHVHNPDMLTQLHCIRRADEDEPGGSSAALARCRAFIEAEVANALAGHEDAPWLALDRRVSVAEYLPHAGQTRVEYSALGFHLGRALHAVQDAHTHTYRDEQGRVTVVLNWTEMIAGELDEGRDGPPHLASFDDCGNPHERVQRGRTWAQEDSRAFLDAAMSGDPQQLAAVLDAVLEVVPGCSESDDWCDTRPPAVLDNDPPGGCAMVDDAERAPWAAPALLLALGLARRRLRSRARSRKGFVAGAAILALTAAPARASTGRPVEPAPPSTRGPGSTDDAPLRIAECGPQCRPLAAELRAFGSANELAFGFASELQFSGPRFGLAVGAEVNPWVRHLDLVVTAGTLSPYLSGVHRLPLGRASLRQRASVGLAILLQDAHPHDAGSVGPFFEFAPLGVEFYGRRARFAFVLDGIAIALPIVGPTHTPLAPTQYRFGVGFRL